MENMDLRTVLLVLASLVLTIVAFNFYTVTHEAKEENAELKEEVERLKTLQSQEQAIYTRTEDFLQAILEGGSIEFFSKSLKQKTEEELAEEEEFQDGHRSRMKDFEIFNISVQQEENEYRVYAIYKVALTGPDGELEYPGDQSLLYLTSKILWVEEEGEWKVDAHELQPLTTGEEVVKDIAS